MLRQAGEDIRNVATSVGPAVVGVGRRGRVGSGVVIAAGRIATNAHNIHADRSTVTFADRRRHLGTVVGFDPDGDLAVIDVDTGDASPPAWADGTELRIGDPVIALANPGGRGLRATFGFVSGTDRTFRGPRGRRLGGAIEHTAPLLPGSSGGPLVDLEGRLLGINTHRLGDGFYLAMAANEDLQRSLDDLGSGRPPQRARLGIAVVPGFVATRMRRAVGLGDQEGVLVRAVDDDGPAALAGIEPGDLITEVAGLSIADVDDLHAALDATAPGSVLQVKAVRGAEPMEFEVTVAEG